MRAFRQRRERERGVGVENPHFERKRVPKTLAEAFVGMRVRIDEAGDDDAPGGVDHPKIAASDGFLRSEIGADRGNPVAFDQDIGAVEMGQVRPRHHIGVADEDGFTGSGNRHCVSVPRLVGFKKCSGR